MFEQGLTQATELPNAERNKMLKRLDAVRGSLRGIGWGVSDAVNEVWHHRVNSGPSLHRQPKPLAAAVIRSRHREVAAS